jgi:predicted RNA-binding Zn ribbon-like protein
VERIDGQLVRPDQPIAIGLVSTVHVADGAVVDGLASPGQLATWLRLHADRLGPGPRPDPARALAPVRALRDALHRLLRAAVDGAAPAADDVALVNDAVRAAPQRTELRWGRRGGPVAEVVAPADPLAALLGQLAADGIELVTGAHGEVRACGAPSCVLFFVRGHARQAWCSAACGNRARVARHYRRTH